MSWGGGEHPGVTPSGAPSRGGDADVTARIWDVNQKSLYLRNNQLVAGHLQGANAALEGEVGPRGRGGGGGGDTRGS